MKAVRVHQWGGPRDLVIEEVGKPEPTETEALIKVESAALNFPDLLLIAGKYQVKPELPFTPGLEVAGVVEQCGAKAAAAGIKEGQRVMAQLGVGGLSEYVVAQYSSITPMPERMSFDEAAGFPLVYQTSYFGLVHRARLRKGETVLVHSAAGGVGLAAVQIARALGASKVIGTVGSDSKADLVRENGANPVVNYQTQDFVEVVKRETNGRGADVIYDPVGGEIGERSAKCIAFEGRLLIIGFTSGKFSNFVSNHILIKNYSVVGLHWGSYRQHNPALIEQAWKELNALYDQGQLKPVVGGRYAIENVAEAMEFLGSREAVGKVVLHW
jgi:NADPH:quinone reductase